MNGLIIIYRIPTSSLFNGADYYTMVCGVFSVNEDEDLCKRIPRKAPAPVATLPGGDSWFPDGVGVRTFLLMKSWCSGGQRVLCPTLKTRQDTDSSPQARTTSGLVFCSSGCVNMSCSYVMKTQHLTGAKGFWCYSFCAASLWILPRRWGSNQIVQIH